MKEMFGEKINLSIYTTDSEEARKYDFRSSTNVLFEGEMMPLEIVLDKNKMKTFLSDKLS
jgi:hypothetical protein